MVGIVKKKIEYEEKGEYINRFWEFIVRVDTGREKLDLEEDINCRLLNQS